MGGRLATKRARARQAIQMMIAGIPQKAIADEMGCSPRWIRTLATWGEKHGMFDEEVESTRRALTKATLPKLKKVYDQVLDGSLETVGKHERAHNVKLKAADSLAKGLGVFATREEKKVTKLTAEMGIADYLRIRELRQQGALPGDAQLALPPREDDTIDAELIGGPVVLGEEMPLEPDEGEDEP